MSILWQKIPDWPYEISDKGHIVRILTQYDNPTRKIISQSSCNGYKIVTLHNQGKSRRTTVNRLMCEAFFGKRKNLQAAHKDGNRSNNVIENLYWATPKEQARDRINHGNNLSGEACTQSIFTDKEITEIKTKYKLLKKKHSNKKLPNGSLKKLAEEYGIKSSYLCNIVSGLVWVNHN